jgi:hypothetical protein
MFEIYIIQTYSDKTARWTQTVDLSKVRYQLYFSWNTRMQSWSMSVMDSDGALLLGGIRLVSGIDLLKNYKASAPQLPAGILRILDRHDDPSTAELTRDNFGTRFVLTYTETGG